MNCESFESIVVDLAREQMMEANAQEQALAHLGECKACALRLETERTLTQGLRALATEMNDAEAPARLEEELRAAFRSQAFSQPAHSTSRWSYWIVAAAAALLIVFGIAGLRLRLALPSEQGPSTLETAATNTLPKDPTLIVDASPATSSSKQKSRVASGPRRTNVHRRTTHFSKRDGSASVLASAAAIAGENYRQSEVATEFMPLGYVSPMNLQDGGQVVRVELPRSAMVSLGLPVNMDRYSQRVKADVLVGTDGLARAIRFVQ